MHERFVLTSILRPGRLIGTALALLVAVTPVSCVKASGHCTDLGRESGCEAREGSMQPVIFALTFARGFSDGILTTLNAAGNALTHPVIAYEGVTAWLDHPWGPVDLVKSMSGVLGQAVTKYPEWLLRIVGWLSAVVVLTIGFIISVDWGIRQVRNAFRRRSSVSGVMPPLFPLIPLLGMLRDRIRTASRWLSHSATPALIRNAGILVRAAHMVRTRRATKVRHGIWRRLQFALSHLARDVVDGMRTIARFPLAYPLSLSFRVATGVVRGTIRIARFLLRGSWWYAKHATIPTLALLHQLIAYEISFVENRNVALAAVQQAGERAESWRDSEPISDLEAVVTDLCSAYRGYRTKVYAGPMGSFDTRLQTELNAIDRAMAAGALDRVVDMRVETSMSAYGYWRHYHSSRILHWGNQQARDYSDPSVYRLDSFSEERSLLERLVVEAGPESQLSLQNRMAALERCRTHQEALARAAGDSCSGLWEDEAKYSACRCSGWDQLPDQDAAGDLLAASEYCPQDVIEFLKMRVGVQPYQN